MLNETFLHLLAKQIINSHSDNITELTVILPNRRAKVFLLNELKKVTTQTIFSPEIISIEDFIQNIAGIRSIDSTDLLFEFYEVYLSIPDEKQDAFENFANWAKTLLQDFNEIDRYLIEPDKILKYLENIKEIEHWSVSIEKTELIEKHLAFWKKLPEYYHALYKHLVSKGIGYQGLIYREAVENCNHFTNSLSNQYFIFAGFNALNQAEEKIVQHLLSLDLASIYWDIDETFLNDSLHDAGLFQRRFKTDWSYYKNHPYDWISKEFKDQKSIHFISTSKLIGQAKIAGKIIEEYSLHGNLQNTALVLGDENLLLPVLHSLPDKVSALNITMGFTGKNNPAQILISKLFKLHINASTRNENSYVFYYKDALDILTHPLVDRQIYADELVSIINRNNYSFITHSKLFELQNNKNPLFELLFQKWENNPIKVLETISEILLSIKSSLDYTNDEEKITNAFVYSIYKVINKLQTYFLNHNTTNDLKTLHSIFKQIIDLAEVSFEGEPLEGLQIMGVLESRVLDFENVIITSVNEGKFPAGKSINSFIPYDVKKEYGLPTYKEKDAIYTFHFYHLLQRAKNIYLIYNTESDGFESGEKSRFITQLEVEKQENHHYIFENYHPDIPSKANELMVIPKSKKVIERLDEIATDKGFSPSALTTYIRNPIQFYFQRILRISESDEVEENIAVNTLGTIIHGVLEELYKPFIGRILTKDDIQNCFVKIDTEVLTQFKKIYKEGEIKKGRNLLAFEVAKRNVYNFIKIELEALENGDEVQIVGLEVDLSRELLHDSLPFPIKISGKVDRIELRNNRVRIIDYKTGKVEQKDVTLRDWNGLTSDIKNEKIIQVLAYAFMFEKEANHHEIEAGIISFKNLKSGFLPFNFKQDKEGIDTISAEILENYIEQIVILLQEIFNTEIPFEEKIN